MGLLNQLGFQYKVLTYIVWFSVRARALGSFLSGIVAVIAGNLLGVSDSLAFPSHLADTNLGLDRSDKDLPKDPYPFFLLAHRQPPRRMVDLGYSLGD